MAGEAVKEEENGSLSDAQEDGDGYRNDEEEENNNNEMFLDQKV